MCTSLVFARLGPSGLALLLAALVLLAAFVAQYAGARRAAARCATLQALAEPAAPLGIHAALADLNRAFGGSDVRFAHALGAALLDERGDPVRFAAAARRALFADLRPLIGTGREAARVVASAAPLLGTILAVAGLGGALRGGGARDQAELFAAAAQSLGGAGAALTLALAAIVVQRFGCFAPPDAQDVDAALEQLRRRARRSDPDPAPAPPASNGGSHDGGC